MQDVLKPSLYPDSLGQNRRTTVPEMRGQSRARRKFLRYFPAGFKDEGHYASERDYKWDAQLRWHEALNQDEYQRLLAAGRYGHPGRCRAGVQRSDLLRVVSGIPSSTARGRAPVPPQVGRARRKLRDK